MSINADQFRQYVVRPTLQKMGMWSQAAENLVMGIAAVESNMGEFLKQLGNGPAVGVFQIEPVTASDVVHRYLEQREDLQDDFQEGWDVLDLADIDWSEVPVDAIAEKLITDLRFGCAIARLKLWMIPAALPSAHDLPGQAQYWKDYYNTEGGKGEPEEFIEKYRKYGC